MRHVSATAGTWSRCCLTTRSGLRGIPAAIVTVGTRSMHASSEAISTFSWCGSSPAPAVIFTRGLVLRNALADNGTLFCEGGKISDLSDGADRLTLGVKSVIAEAAADETSARVRRSLQANADRGRPHGRLLFGYRRVRDDRTGRPVGQVPDEEQAAVVRRVFAEYNAGSSRQDIANGLNAEGIKTGTDKDWSHAASVTFYATSPMPGGASITAKISPRQIGIR